MAQRCVSDERYKNSLGVGGSIGSGLLCRGYERAREPASISYAILRMFGPRARISQHGVRRWPTILPATTNTAVYRTAMNLARIRAAISSAGPPQSAVADVLRSIASTA